MTPDMTRAIADDAAGAAGPAEVGLVIGTGGVGAACARRMALAAARRGTEAGVPQVLVVADVRRETAERLADELRATTDGATDGVTVVAEAVDVGDEGSVRRLAGLCAGHGAVLRAVHTAGVSPEQADTATVIAVDLVGTAHVVDALGEVVGDGGALVVVASMAGRLFGPSLEPQTERDLAHLPAPELSSVPQIAAIADPQTAYGYAKRGNQLRVAASAGPWGARGARLNSVSPGVIDTDMGRAELSGASGAAVRDLVEGSPLGRAARPDEIASVAMFLLGEESSFVTGTDLLVDGGAMTAFA